MTKSVIAMKAITQQWKGCLVGVLMGICIASLLQAPSLFTPFYQIWNAPSPFYPSQHQPTKGKDIFERNATHFQGFVDVLGDGKDGMSNLQREQLALLIATWEASNMFLFQSLDHSSLAKGFNFSPSEVPNAPHLESCEERSIINERLDAWGESGTLPFWTLWKGQSLGLNMDMFFNPSSHDYTTKKNIEAQSLYPPWVEGADEDNLPRTRQVQVDIWKHQHPINCQNSTLRFLLADWETDPGLGIGAQIASMAGLLAIAINEQRILVSNYYNRADHEECLGSDHARWSCYFLSETSKECRSHALVLASQSSAWEQGLITSKSNYTSRQIWAGKTPRQWGKPWEAMQPTTQIEGKLLIHHKASDRRWWRAQAVRYFMRFPSKYMCLLLNEARHNAFGVEAAKMVLNTLPLNWPKETFVHNGTDIEQFVWKSYKPWLPRPLVSIHVRQGDKAKEMKLFGLKNYMKLAQQLRDRFPQARSIWLSTEMQVC